MGNSTSSIRISSNADDFEFDETSEGDSLATPFKSLHGSLMSVKQKQDPNEYYEIFELLGEGSMGSVSKVKKRLTAIGGSARASFRQRKHRSRKLSISNSCFQPCFAFCPISSPKKNSFVHSTENSSEKFQIINPDNISDDSKTFGNFSAANSLSSSISSYRKKHRQHSRLRHKQLQLEHEKYERELLQKQLNQKLAPLQSSVRSNASSAASAPSSDDPSQGVSRARNRSKIIKHGHRDVYYALKTIILDRAASADFMKELENEVEILKDLDHPNIVKAIETFNHRKRLYIVLELCSGGDLYNRDPYSEQDAIKIVRDMMSAVAYMHSKNITHRDLKYENIMFTSTSPHAEVKLIDFGLSKKYACNTYLHDTVGTVYTMAPELLKGGYTSKVDVWSMGVIAFMLLSSSMPFYGKDRKHVMRKIVKGKYSFASRRWGGTSDESRRFISYLLLKDPKKRPNAEQALMHRWLAEQNVNGNGSIDGKSMSSTSTDDDGDASKDASVLDEVQATIQTFADYGILKKLALMIVAYKSTDEEIGFLRQIFNKFDGLKDGEVTLPEFKAALTDYLYSDEELEEIFTGIDIDGTGCVHYSEFLAATIEAHGAINEERLAEAFDRLDNDDSGYITVTDLKEFLGDDIPTDYINEMIDAVDLDHDHKISYHDFLAMWDDSVDEKRQMNQQQVRKRRTLKREQSNSSMESDTDFSGLTTDDDDKEDHAKFYFLQEKRKSVRLTTREEGNSNHLT